LIKALPKEHRKKLVPLSDSAEIIAAGLPVDPHTSLANALSDFIRRRLKIEIPATAWDETALPDYLRMRIALTDAKGRVIKTSRDSAVLTLAQDETQDDAAFQQARLRWERGPILEWDFGDLPEMIQLKGAGGRQWDAYPALEARDGVLFLTVFSEAARARKVHAQGVKTLLMRRLAGDIKFLRKNLRLSAAFDGPGRYFGGRKALEEQLADRVIDELMLTECRTAASFQARVQQLQGEAIAGEGQIKREHVMAVISTYADLRLQLDTLAKAHAGKPQGQAFLETMRQALAKLVPNNFILLYGDERLQRLVPYMQAIALRADRGLVNPDKEAAKARLIEPFEQRLAHLARQLTPQSSQEKRGAVESLFWMLEEYKISVFAQEIKTAHPVSAQRLENQLCTIEALV
jgi:ATP-dependent helicase HrpA